MRNPLLFGALLACLRVNANSPTIYRDIAALFSFRDVNFENMDLSGANLHRIDLTGANLSGANLTGTNLSGANLSGANLSGANLSGANLTSANLTSTSLQGADLTEVEGFELANFLNADLRGAAPFAKAFEEWEIIDRKSLTQQKKIQLAIDSGILPTLLLYTKSKARGYENVWEFRDAAGVNLSGINMSKMDLSGMDLTGANLTEADLSSANLTGANLTEADLTGANLSEADLLSNANLTRADLTRANLRWADLPRANLTEANLTEANLTGADLSRANLSGANLTNANLSRANLNNTDLTNANLSRANLNNADLSRANLSGANLSGANLTSANLTSTSLQGVDLTEVEGFELANFLNADLRGAAPFAKAFEEWEIIDRQSLTQQKKIQLAIDSGILPTLLLYNQNKAKGYGNVCEFKDALAGVNLNGMNMSKMNLSGANLSGANLSGANLSGANLILADLRGADLREADLRKANLRGADLRGADLRGADLREADLRKANLRGADLTGTNPEDALSVAGADFTGVIGLSAEQRKKLREMGATCPESNPGRSPSSGSTRYLSPDPLTPEQVRQATGGKPTDLISFDDGSAQPRPRSFISGSTPEQPGPTTQPATNPPGSTSSPAPTTNQGGGIVIAPPLLTRDQKLQLMRDLGIDPTGIRPDLLDDPELKRLLREFQKTGDQNQARNDLEKWLKLKGFDLTPDGNVVPRHTGHTGDKPNLEMPQTRFPQGPDPLLTQALSNLKNSNNPADLVRQWSKEEPAKLRALLTQAGLEQVLSYGLGGTLLACLSQGGLSRFLSAYDTQGVLKKILADPRHSTLKTSALAMLSKVQNVLSAAQATPVLETVLPSATPTKPAKVAPSSPPSSERVNPSPTPTPTPQNLLTEALSIVKNNPSSRSTIVSNWAATKDPRLLSLLTHQGVAQMVKYGLAGSVFQTLITHGYGSMLQGYRVPQALSKLVHQASVPPSVREQSLRLLGDLVTWQSRQAVSSTASGSATTSPANPVLQAGKVLGATVQKALSGGPQAVEQAVKQGLRSLETLRTQVLNQAGELGAAGVQVALQHIENVKTAFHQLLSEPNNPLVLATAAVAVVAVVALLPVIAGVPVGL